jgi:hypothetical protein
MFDKDRDRIPSRLNNTGIASCCTVLYICSQETDFGTRYCIDRTFHKSSVLVCMGMNCRNCDPDDRKAQSYARD